MSTLKEGQPVQYWPEPNDMNIKANGRRTPVDAVVMRVISADCANIMLFEEDVEPMPVSKVQFVKDREPGCFTLNPVS
jgi:hypothetical protein